MYSRVFVAGTFDNLHDGHELLLTRAFEEGEKVTIGLTTDTFVKTFKKDFRRIRPFAERKKTLIMWLTDRRYNLRATVLAIDNPYEPAVSDAEGEVLVVTPENKARGEEINEKRKARGLPPYALMVVPLLPAEDAKPISSTRVRNGEIDRTGRLNLPNSLRPELVKPLGEVLVGDSIGTSIEKHRNGIVIAVGDITTKTLLTAGVTPELIIVDFRVKRKPFPELDTKLTDLNLYRVNVKSGPGFIANDAIDLIKKWSTHPTDKTVLVVDGEEDLLALPAIAYGPENALVYYGQPQEAAWACGPTMHEGMVEVMVTPEKKNEAVALLKRFS